jgi:hypothetical protein
MAIFKIIDIRRKLSILEQLKEQELIENDKKFKKKWGFETYNDFLNQYKEAKMDFHNAYDIVEEELLEKHNVTKLTPKLKKELNKEIKEYAELYQKLEKMTDPTFNWVQANYTHEYSDEISKLSKELYELQEKEKKEEKKEEIRVEKKKKPVVLTAATVKKLYPEMEDLFYYLVKYDKPFFKKLKEKNSKPLQEMYRTMLRLMYYGIPLIIKLKNNNGTLNNEIININGSAVKKIIKDNLDGYNKELVKEALGLLIVNNSILTINPSNYYPAEMENNGNYSYSEGAFDNRRGYSFKNYDNPTY